MDTLRTRVISFLEKEIEMNHIPGAVLQVSYKGETIMREAIGSRMVYPKKEPMTVNTVFDLASLTKVVCTLPAILKLIDNELISLNDSISDFLPVFSQHHKENVKIRHLLTHTSGLPAQRKFYLDGLNSKQIFESIYSEELEYPIGSKVVYSDLGFMILYKLIEHVTREKFESYVQREIFDQLEMSETGFNPTFSSDRYASTEFSEKLNRYKHGIVHDSNAEIMGGISGHAGLFSTIHDLKKYASMIENNGFYNGKRILSEAVMEASRKNYSSFDKEFRGLGWLLKNDEVSPCGDLFSDNSYGHTGFTGTSIWFDPNIDLHVIFLTNRVHYGRTDHISRIRSRLHNIIRAYFN